MNTGYTVDYFIAKFEAIPEEKWCVDEYVSGEKCCALGHCGAIGGKWTAEAYALDDLFLTHDVTFVNDRSSNFFPQPTPKQRILAALREIKAKGAK